MNTSLHITPADRIEALHATRAANWPDYATHASQVIEGQLQATAFLDRIAAGTAQPDELAKMFANLQGAQEPVDGVLHAEGAASGESARRAQASDL
jgi:hypothetical protein